VVVHATSQVSGVRLTVTAHCLPSFPQYVCPTITPDCFEPWPVCVDGGTLFINSSETCIVGVAPTLWSQVKRLYD
jgi:hypothetical protein